MDGIECLRKLRGDVPQVLLVQLKRRVPQIAEESPQGSKGRTQLHEKVKGVLVGPSAVEFDHVGGVLQGQCGHQISLDQQLGHVAIVGEEGPGNDLESAGQKGRAVGKGKL